MSEYTQDQQPRGGFGRRNTDRVATARLAVNQGDGNRKGVNPVGLNAVLAYAEAETQAFLLESGLANNPNMNSYFTEC